MRSSAFRWALKCPALSPSPRLSPLFDDEVFGRILQQDQSRLRLEDSPDLVLIGELVGLGAGPCIAGPLLRLSIRNWMPVASMAKPMAPPRASISRTICPLPTPPMAGLQLIWAMVSRLLVTSAVFAPKRAAASAASAPACPPPITRTSKSWQFVISLLSHNAGECKSRNAIARPFRERHCLLKTRRRVQ